MAPRVVLVGVPGSGKSTVAAAIAEQLALTHIDTDVVVEQNCGTSISNIFVDSGEAYFREAEREAVAASLMTNDTVVSLGGGAILNADTRDDLRDASVVWLQVGLAAAAQRVGINQSRPLLLGNVRATLAQLLDERAPLYSKVASLTIATDERTPGDIATQIVDWLQS